MTPPRTGAIAQGPPGYKARREKRAVLGILDGTTSSKYRRRPVLNKTFVVMMTALFSFISSEAGISAPSDTNGNTAEGTQALFSNTTGNADTAIGTGALYKNTTGGSNTATGMAALGSNRTGSSNTATGARALLNATGNYNVALGDSAGELLGTGDNNIDIGYNVLGVKGDSNTIRIGNTDIRATYISGISGQTVVGSSAVFVDSNGKLGTMAASTRFSDAIKPMDKASEAILAFKPVTFHYKSDKTNRAEFGLIAEDVAKVDPDLVVRDRNGEIYSVRYEEVNAMLLNEFLKEHRRVQELQANAAKQEKQIAALAAGLQKVSAKLEASKPAPQVVNDP